MSDNYEMRIGDLKDQIKELEEELHQQRFNNHHNLSVDQKVSDQVAELEKESKKYREALEFYADKDNWRHLGVKKGNRFIRIDDMEMIDCSGKWGGKRARQALNK